MLDRRRFIMTLAAAATARSGRATGNRHSGFGALQADPQRILDLPSGFRYDVVARSGDDMDDGLQVPAEADGMAAFAGPDGQVILVCNHENSPAEIGSGPFGHEPGRLRQYDTKRIYDAGEFITPGTGGTSTIAWDPRGRRRLRQHMSLVGTEVNCAGGPTPWGSWLSCEESFTDPGPATEYGQHVTRERRHGYVFEIPANAREAVLPRPLTALGRFEHEAAAVDPRSGAVYLSEDRHRSLWYRFLPDVPGKLAEGGRLQALAIASEPSFDTRNWGRMTDLEVGRVLQVSWVDLPEADVDSDDLRLRGFALGAARFARGEGLCYGDGELYLTCTIGGRERRGQVFALRPASGDTPDQLRLVAEADSNSLLQNADNLTMSPWGDLIVCEDTADHCGLVGVRPDGRQYPVADNAYSNSELAGVCFSPDGSQMFVNLQKRGLTLAISGPWQRPAA